MPPSLQDLIQRHLADGDYTGWFDAVYDNTREAGAPWSKRIPHPHLVAWAERESLDGKGKQALVTGCGEGDDAIYLELLGFTVTAFDVAPKAIEICHERFPQSETNFVVADLFDLPDEWSAAFDFVLDNRTIQALPPHLTADAMQGVASTVAPGGTLLILCHGRDDDSERTGIPWALSRADLAAFSDDYGLTETQFEDVSDDTRRFRVTYQRPSDTD